MDYYDAPPTLFPPPKAAPAGTPRLSTFCNLSYI